MDLFHLQQPGIDWTTYGPNAIRDSDTIIIATSAAYKERWENQRESRLGAGAAREAAVLKDLIDRDQTTFYKKVVVVLLPGTSVDDVPAELAWDCRDSKLPASICLILKICSGGSPGSPDMFLRPSDRFLSCRM